MSRRIFGIALLCGSVIGTQSFAAGSCTRESLQSAADSYVEAQTKGDPSMIKLASPVKYIENLKDADIKTGILSSAQKIDFSRSFLDTDQCETFTEVIITDPKHPYVLGTRLRLDGGKVSEINSLVTDEGDWLFNAANDLKWSPQEDWGVIPKDKQGTRESLMAAANAYFDFFSDKNVKVPWGTPCNRLEGGLRTGKGTPDDTCNVGVPNGIKFPGRRYVVDADQSIDTCPASRHRPGHFDLGRGPAFADPHQPL